MFPNCYNPNICFIKGPRGPQGPQGQDGQDASLKNFQSGTGECPDLIEYSYIRPDIFPNCDLVIESNGDGALMRTEPDGTVSGGNCRGRYAVDLQSSRNANTQVASADYSVISGGRNNSITHENFSSFIGGGEDNIIDYYSVPTNPLDIPNYACSIIGGTKNSITGTFNTYSIINGGRENSITGSFDLYSFIGNGYKNLINCDSGYGSTIINGYSNSITGSYNSTSCIISGQINKIYGEDNNNSIICNGLSNIISGQSNFTSFIGGGSDNTITGNINNCSFIGGGSNNTINGTNNISSFIGGGSNNTITSSCSCIPGGEGLSLTATSYSTAVGCYNLDGAIDIIGYNVLTDVGIVDNVPIQTNRLFMVGNGTTLSKSNAFSVTTEGYAIAKQGVLSNNGADVAELFEIYVPEGDEISRIPVGTPVTFYSSDEVEAIPDKFRKIQTITSQSQQAIGVISDTYYLLSNAATDEWQNKYKKDKYGSILYEKIKSYILYIKRNRDKLKSDDSKLAPLIEAVNNNIDTLLQNDTEETRNILINNINLLQELINKKDIPSNIDKFNIQTVKYDNTELTIFLSNLKSRLIENKDEIVPIINPDYDPNKEYISRTGRKEWHAVGLTGVVKVLKSFVDNKLIPQNWIRVPKNTDKDPEYIYYWYLIK